MPDAVDDDGAELTRPAAARSLRCASKTWYDDPIVACGEEEFRFEGDDELLVGGGGYTLGIVLQPRCAGGEDDAGADDVAGEKEEEGHAV